MATRVVAAVLVGGWAAATAGAVSLDRNLAWMAGYNDAVNGDDIAQAVTMDAAGNVTVAGWAKYANTSTAADIVVIRYDPSGAILWSRTHNSFPGGTDYAFGIASAPDGSLYVAGSVSNTGGASDGWLRKYDAAGAVLWTMTYTSPSAGDQAVFYAVAVDPVSGSVFVAGTEVRSDLFQYGNGVVAKVAPATGDIVWTGTFNDAANLWDEALGVAVDPDGGAVVTGYETEDDAAAGTSLSGDILDRAATRLDPTLTTLNTRIVVHRFDASGVQQASLVPYDGDPLKKPHMNAGNAVAVAADGSVYVGGVEETPSPAFMQRWVRKYGAPNGPYGGAPLWTKVVGEATSGSDVSDTATAVALDPLGGLVVVGESSHDDIHEGQNITVEELDPVQMFAAWRAGYNSGFNLDDAGQGVAVNAAGRVAVVGSAKRTDLAEKKNWVVLAYALVPPPAPLLGNTRAWPSPFNPRTAVGGEAKIGPLPDGATVHLYTMAGGLVRELREQGGMVRWDGRNGGGTPVAEGVYLWVARCKGQSSVKGTLAVSRR